MRTLDTIQSGELPLLSIHKVNFFSLPRYDGVVMIKLLHVPLPKFLKTNKYLNELKYNYVVSH